MNSFKELAYGRRSIRKFEPKDIPIDDIADCIKTAVSAPSGCNSQCWKFVAVTDRNVIRQLEAVVIKKTEELLAPEKYDLTEQYMSSKRKMVSFFSKAPVVVAVFMSELEYYDPTMISVLKQQGYTHDDVMKLIAYPDLLSIGAAVQNFLLAVHEKGYGACWTNEPAVAGKEIAEILNIPKNNKFISLIPVGFPAYTPREKKMKEFDEVFTVI